MSMSMSVHEYEGEEDEEDGGGPATTPFLSPAGGNGVLGVVAAALRKSLVTCSVDVASDVDIGWPTDVRHVTFDRFNGFLGLPLDLPPIPPSASATVFGVSAESMQCSFDQRGNSVPTILLRMQSRLYSEGGLQAEGIFRINAENSEEANVREELNRGVVPHGIDVHCLSGLIKESGILDCLSAEEVMHCNTEEECSQLVKQLPPTEAALLEWAINLMADVVHHQHLNKMNARNVAMVFAPNMTHMADPLTALIHAVQLINFLNTLIAKTLAQRQQSLSTTTALQPQPQPQPYFDDHRILVQLPRRTLGHSFKDEYEAAEDRFLHRLSLSWKGMQKLCRHPVFHFTKTPKIKNLL